MTADSTAPARLARLLAGFQLADLVVTQVSPRYGGDHLDHLGVPGPLRPVLPIVKAAAVGGLVVTARRPTARAAVAAALVPYYVAATTFHVLAEDPPSAAAPAAACAVLAAALACAS